MTATLNIAAASTTNTAEMVDWKNINTDNVYPAVLRTDVEFVAEKLDSVKRIAYKGDSCFVFPLPNDRVGMWFVIRQVYASVTRDVAKAMFTVEKTPRPDSFVLSAGIELIDKKETSTTARVAVITETGQGSATGFVKQSFDLGADMEIQVNVYDKVDFNYFKLVPLFGKGVLTTHKNCEGMSYQLVEVATGNKFLVSGTEFGICIIGKTGVRSEVLEALIAEQLS